jgi:Zn finger protein HypA/HybF involved in hydrogenase expression
MKCVCGYEGENFIQILINVPMVKTWGEFTSDYDKKEIFIFSCPKCGTLKTEVKEGR